MRKSLKLFSKISIIFSLSFLLILYITYFFYAEYSKTKYLENQLFRNSINSKIVSVDLNLLLLNSKKAGLDKEVLKDTKENLIYSSNYIISGKKINFLRRSFPEDLSLNNKLISRDILKLQNNYDFEFIKILANESKFRKRIKNLEASNTKLWNSNFKNQYLIFNFTGILRKRSIGIILKTMNEKERIFEVYLTDYIVDKLNLSPLESFYIFDDKAELLFSNNKNSLQESESYLKSFIKNNLNKSKIKSGVQLDKIGEEDFLISYEEIPTFGFWAITVAKNEYFSDEIRVIKNRLSYIFAIVFILAEILIFLSVSKMSNDA